VAGDALHRSKNTGIADSTRAELPLHHPPPFFFKSGLAIVLHRAEIIA